MIKLKKGFIIVIWLSISQVTFCQAVPELQLITPAKDFNIQERVLMTMGQDFYLAGERVRFFAQTFDAALQIPVDLSAVLYIELFNQDNNVVNSKKIRLKNGEAVNHIDIPRQLRTGYYYIRAYTNYMKNFGHGCFFSQRIKIVNPFYKIIYLKDDHDQNSELDLEISAESGSIVYNIKNKLTFHDLNANDRILARLVENDSVIAETETHNGWGTFHLTPKPSNKYHVEAISLNREKTVVEINDIVHSGVICKLDSIENNYAHLNIKATNFDKYPISLFVENNGLQYEYNKQLNPSVNHLKLKLPEGVNSIILKNNTDEQIASRLVYIKPNPAIEITAQVDKPVVTADDSVLVQINSDYHDSIQYVVSLNLGNSNTLPSLPELMESSIYTSSISSFTNNISSNEINSSSKNMENINDYIIKFQHDSFKYAGLEKIDYLPEITHDIVSGHVIKRSDRSLAVHKTVYQAFVDSICWVNHSKTDSSGKFFFTLPFENQGNDHVLTLKDTTENYSIHLQDEFYPYFPGIDKKYYYPDSSLKEVIESRMLNLQVIDAYDDLYQKPKVQRSSLRFYGYPNVEYYFKDYIDLPNLEEFIFEIVKEVAITRKNNKTDIRVLYETTYNRIGDNPMIIFDGVPLNKISHLLNIPTTELESIRIFNDKFFYGAEIYDGVVDINSNNNNFDLVDIDKNTERKIFSPVVTSSDTQRVIDTRIPRYVSDIFFDQVIGMNGKSEIKIGMPQNTGDYTLTIFGYTKNGEWGSYMLPQAVTIVR